MISSIKASFYDSIYENGERGTRLLQSAGEPSTQMTLNTFSTLPGYSLLNQV